MSKISVLNFGLTIKRLLDTKYMASIAPLKEIVTATALGDMQKILCKDPFPAIVLGKF